MDSLLIFYITLLCIWLSYVGYAILQLSWNSFQKDKYIYQQQTGKYEDIYYCEDCKKVQSLNFCWHSNLGKYGGFICGYCESTSIVKRIAKHIKAIWKDGFMVIGGRWEFYDE